ncbi:B- and T-lymphocyte attenuator-like [Pelobates fuscus]|uniref:B- and T-lymphocyte attenuator-like n=1 Tax=Pelobates fuscus TaxID=191477 RepID=UPI002FE4A836
MAVSFLLWLPYLLLTPVNVFSCINSINIPRNTQYNATIGETLSLRCPLQLCPDANPRVTWCKMTSDRSCQFVEERVGISFHLAENKTDSAVYLLNFTSTEVNDTGFYKCSAQFLNQQAVGHLIKVNILERIPGNENPQEEIWRGHSLPFYFFLLMIILLVVVIFISVLFCVYRHKGFTCNSSEGKPKVTSSRGEIRPKSLSGARTICDHATKKKKKTALKDNNPVIYYPTDLRTDPTEY